MPLPVHKVQYIAKYGKNNETGNKYHAYSLENAYGPGGEGFSPQYLNNE